MWAATAASYCPSRAGQLPKQNMMKPHKRWDVKLCKILHAPSSLSCPAACSGSPPRCPCPPPCSGGCLSSCSPVACSLPSPPPGRHSWSWKSKPPTQKNAREESNSEIVIQCLSDIVTINLWQNRPKQGPVTCPKCQISTQELSPCDNYRPVTIFWPCPEVDIISDKHRTAEGENSTIVTALWYFSSTLH